MHAPWMQLAKEVRKVNAPQFAAELDVGVGDAFLMLNDFLEWAIERCPENQPPSSAALIKGNSAGRQIAQAMGWKGDVPQLVAALNSLPYPMIELLPEGIRIRGLDRYDRGWRKSHPKQAAAWKTANPLAADDDEEPGFDFGAETGTNRDTKPALSRHPTGHQKPPPDPDPDPDPDNQPPPYPPPSSATPVGPETVVVVDVGKCWSAVVAAFAAEGVEPEKKRPKAFEAWVADRHREVLDGLRDGFTPRDVHAAVRDFLRDKTIRSHAAAVFIKNCWESRLKHLGPEPAPPTPLELEFEERLKPLLADGHGYAASQLRVLRPVAIAGDVLQLRTHDPRYRDWVADHYGEVMKGARLELLAELAS